MTPDIETILVAVIAVAALALGYVRQQRHGQGQSREAPAEIGQPSDEQAPRKSRRTTTRTKAAKAPTGGADSAPPAASGRVERTAAGTGLFAGVSNWGYQLQKVIIAEVAASPFQMMVVDYSADGSDDRAFTRADVERMQVMPDGGRRIVLSYMSVGEAESYRYYWDPMWNTTPPAWLLDENPEWKENYSVRFWDPGWQRLFFGGKRAYLDRIIDAGFDGVYLDKCDVFEDFQQGNKKVAAERPNMEVDMVEFVERLSRYAKGRKPNFAIVMQNAEVLLEHEPLREAIDAVAKEQLLYGYTGPEKANPKDEIVFSKNALDLARKAGRTVFVVEYVGSREKQATALATLDSYGYVGTVSSKNRALDHLNPDPSAIA
ncbi:MAG: endo alpha-1,4 polygalactosaminidase [Hyphomicrobiaceae bacterium]|nr:endo alpha-1,4 polygalactosaminidase [Hyphomicrobiaceae bacterium]